jgi:hypothetical protein
MESDTNGKDELNLSHEKFIKASLTEDGDHILIFK